MAKKIKKISYKIQQIIFITATVHCIRLISLISLIITTLLLAERNVDEAYERPTRCGKNGDVCSNTSDVCIISKFSQIIIWIIFVIGCLVPYCCLSTRNQPIPRNSTRF